MIYEFHAVRIVCTESSLQVRMYDSVRKKNIYFFLFQFSDAYHLKNGF